VRPFRDEARPSPLPVPAADVRLPPERLVKAVLANLSGWIEMVDEISSADNPRGLALHLKLNMVQCHISLARLNGASEEEIHGLHAQGLQDTAGPKP
jgi:hypothetical protein